MFSLRTSVIIDYNWVFLRKNSLLFLACIEHTSVLLNGNEEISL